MTGLRRAVVKIVERLFLRRYVDCTEEVAHQAHVLTFVLIGVVILLAAVLPILVADELVKWLALGILSGSLAAIAFIARGYLVAATITSFAGIGVLATLIVLTRSVYSNLEAYMLATFHLFIMVVSSLLTRRRRYIYFTWLSGLFYILLALVLRGFILELPGATFELDDYVIAAGLLSLAGFIISKTIQRQAQLLDIATTESEQNPRQMSSSESEPADKA